MGEWERNDDYEYGFEHVDGKEKLTDAAEDADGPDDGDDYGDDEPDDASVIESTLAIERIMWEFNAKPLNLDIAEDTQWIPRIR